MKETFEILKQSTKLVEDYAKLRHIVENTTSTLGLSGEDWTQLFVDIDKGEKEALATRDNILQNIFDNMRQNIFEERQSDVMLANKSAAEKIHPEKMKIVKFGILQRDPEITVDLPDIGIIRGAGYVGKFYEPDEVPDVKDGTHMYKVYRIDKQAGEMELHYSVILKVGEVIEDHVNLIDVRPDYFSRAELEGYLVTNLQIDDMKVLKFMN